MTYSKLGYLVNPQSYIVGAILKGTPVVWKSDVFSYYHTLSINFIEVLPDDLLNDATFTSGLLPKLPSDLFYPLSVVSDSSHAYTLAVSLFATVVGMLCIMF